MSRSELYKQLKKLNPKTKQQWPKVSVSSLEREINIIKDIQKKNTKINKLKVNEEISGVYDINDNLIKLNSKEFKKFSRLGFKVINRKLTPPKTSIELPFTGDYTNLFDTLNENNNIKMVIVNVKEDNLIKQFYLPVDNIRKSIKSILRKFSTGYIVSFILLKGHKSNFGPSYDGEVNCMIELIDNHIKTNNIKSKINIKEVYEEYKNGVFEEDIPKLSKLFNIPINIETLTNKIQYNETTNKINKQLNIFIHNNHAIQQNTTKKSKFINAVGFEYYNTLETYMEKFINYKSIQNIIMSDNNIVFIKTNDTEYRLKYLNGIDLEEENCITDKQYYFNKSFEFFSKKPKNISANDINIDVIKQIKSITINFSKDFETKDCEIVDLKCAYNHFGILPTDLSYFYDATDFNQDEINKLLQHEGFGLIDTIKIGDFTIGGWRGLNIIRHIMNKYKHPIKIKQFMISSNTTNFDIDSFMALGNYEKRRWHNVLGKMQSTSKTISTYTTDPIVGGQPKFYNDKYTLYENVEVKDYIGKNFYPHISGYVQEYINIKMLDKYIELKKQNINVYRGWSDGLYFDKTKKHLVKTDERWQFEDTDDKPITFSQTIQKIKNEPLTNFSKEININPEGFVAYIGGAGFGKSHKLKEIYRANPSKTLILTPTVLLRKSYYANNVHTYQKFIHPTKKDYGFDQYEILLIDEYTMLTPSDFHKVLQVAKNLKQCYLFGDSSQLLNIERQLIDLTNFKVIELTKNYRQLCPIFQKYQTITRNTGNIDYITQKINLEDAIKSKKFILSPINEEIRKINKIGFELNTNELKHGWKIDTPIAFLKERKNFCNGENGIITNIDNQFLYITKSDGIEIKLSHDQSNLIELYYSTTYHKFQGQTIKDKDLVINTNGFNKYCNDDKIRMLYVATSRVVKLEQLYILE